MRHSRKGTVLILALWALALLTVFAIALGVKIRQKIVVVSHLEKRAKLYYAAQAGILKSLALLKREAQGRSFIGKTALFNDEEIFKKTSLGSTSFSVMYVESGAKVYGIRDEERKININTADPTTLMNLFGEAGHLSKERSRELAEAIYDWRVFGESEAGGFLSDDFYESHDYKQKKGNFEVLDELLLVKGITPEIYHNMEPFITIYGNGKVNLNTATKPVLMALGLSSALANKIIMVRQGGDRTEGTADDIIFSSGPELLDFLKDLIHLDEDETRKIAELILQGKISAESSYFMVQSQARLGKSELDDSDSAKDSSKTTGEKKVITCVFNLNSDKIEYWRE
jgi:general secretion pathway protein K